MQRVHRAEGPRREAGRSWMAVVEHTWGSAQMALRAVRANPRCAETRPGPGVWDGNAGASSTACAALRCGRDGTVQKTSNERKRSEKRARKAQSLCSNSTAKRGWTEWGPP